MKVNTFQLRKAYRINPLTNQIRDIDKTETTRGKKQRNGAETVGTRGNPPRVSNPNLNNNSNNNTNHNHNQYTNRNPNHNAKINTNSDPNPPSVYCI